METIPSTYTYIPKYSFGTNNGDGKDWQIWAFSGSNVYDWSDTYANGYLKEQFKIQTTSPGLWCGQCLQRGIFNHDPQKGFESADVKISSLENTPERNQNNTIYNVVLQWDSTGYTYTISHAGVTDATGHTDIANVDENMWVGWDGSYNNFRTFPSGDWYDSYSYFPPGYIGGTNMVLNPYQVYDSSQISSEPTPDPIPDNEIAPLITSYTFNTVADNITINPLVNPLSMVFTASENVDWVSIKIEKQDNASVYKYFYPGTDCMKKILAPQDWNGSLSKGGLLQNGVYKN